MIECIEDIVRQAGKEVDDEPRLEIVHPDDLWIADYLSARSHERRVEVQNNIDKEYNINNRIYNKQRDIFARLVFKGNIIRYHNGGIES